jgi:hypothetical protein
VGGWVCIETSNCELLHVLIFVLSLYPVRSGPDGDKSVSISFTSVGKALASRSHSLHMHASSGLVGAGALGVASSSSVEAAPVPAPTPNPAPTPKLQLQASAGSSLSMRDTSTNMTVDPSRSHEHMTLDDVSECDSAVHSARRDDAEITNMLTIAVKPPVYGTSSGALLFYPDQLSPRCLLADFDLLLALITLDVSGIALQGAVTPLAGSGAGAAAGANIISPQAKVIDAGLRAIIADMVRGIEVAVWDAAMER